MILCGTDFTPCSAEAADVGGALAAHMHTPLLLVHVVDEHGSTDAALKKLEAEAGRLKAALPELRLETRIETGIPDEVLTGMIQIPQLVVVSSLGRRAGGRWSLGSVAERIVQTSRAPVLVVRHAKPFVSWLRRESPLRVVAGFDFSEPATAALEWVSELCDMARCDVTVAHIALPGLEPSRRSSEASARKKQLDREAGLHHEVNGRIREQSWKNGAPAIRILLTAGGRSSALVELATKGRADLLVVGNRCNAPGHLLREPVSLGVLRQARMSIACVPVVYESEDSIREVEASEDRPDLARELENHPFLRGVKGTLLRKLASISREEKFRAGAFLLREGQDANTLFLLQDGLVALELNMPGKGPEQMESLRAGDLLGLSWLFPPYHWHLDARAVEPVQAIAIDATQLREWMKEDTGMGHVVATGLVKQLYGRLERVRMQRLDLYRGAS